MNALRANACPGTGQRQARVYMPTMQDGLRSNPRCTAKTQGGGGERARRREEGAIARAGHIWNTEGQMLGTTYTVRSASPAPTRGYACPLRLREAHETHRRPYTCQGEHRTERKGTAPFNEVARMIRGYVHDANPLIRWSRKSDSVVARYIERVE